MTNADLPFNQSKYAGAYDNYLYAKNYTYFGSLEDFEALVMGGEALKEARKELFDKSFKNKIVVVGDFGSNDTHLTQVGEMYGSLILVNAYWSLVNGKHQITWSFVLFWLVIFSVVSYRALYVESLHVPAWLLPVLRFPLFRFFDYFWLLLGLSFVSYFLFGVHIHVLVFFLYLKAVRYAKMGGRLQQLEKDLAVEHAQSEKLLLNILPKDVAAELKANKGKTKIRRFASASILFADVKGFSKKAEELKKTSPTPAQDLIGLLDATFSEMDNISEKYGLERIKTIGDCYMAVGGVPVANQTHPVDVALAALTIQKWMADEKKKRNGDFWEVRLGFHTGELMAGVIGTQRFAYDVWGSDVNIASRMESGGEIGRVNTTESTKTLIEDFFEFEYRGEIEAKNIGLIRAFFVNRIKPEFSTDTEGFIPNEAFWKRRESRLHTQSGI
jgi:class 3 adenylate cyclase